MRWRPNSTSGERPAAPASDALCNRERWLAKPFEPALLVCEIGGSEDWTWCPDAGVGQAARPTSASWRNSTVRARAATGLCRCDYFLSAGGAAGLPDAVGNGEREAAVAFGLSCLGFFGSRPLRF